MNMKQFISIAGISLLMQACAGTPVKQDRDDRTIINIPKSSSVEVIKKDREDKYTQKLYELNSRNPVQDAQREITRGNRFLLAYRSGRGGGNKAPGLTQQQAAGTSCGFKRLDGFGDTIYGESHLKYRVAMRKYATQFNRTMYPSCSGRSSGSTTYLKTR